MQLLKVINTALNTNKCLIVNNVLNANLLNDVQNVVT